MLLVNQCHDLQKEIYFLLLLVIKIYDEHYYEFRLNVDLLVMAASKLILLEEKYINRTDKIIFILRSCYHGKAV